MSAELAVPHAARWALIEGSLVGRRGDDIDREVRAIATPVVAAELRRLAANGTRDLDALLYDRADELEAQTELRQEPQLKGVTVVDSTAGVLDYVDSSEDTWWHVAYADRPGVFSRNRAEAIRLAKETGAQFVQERGGQRRVVWEAL